MCRYEEPSVSGKILESNNYKTKFSSGGQSDPRTTQGQFSPNPSLSLLAPIFLTQRHYYPRGQVLISWDENLVKIDAITKPTT